MEGHIGRIGFVVLALIFGGEALLGEPEGASAGSIKPSISAPDLRSSPHGLAASATPGFASAGLLDELPGFVMVSMSDDQLAAWHGGPLRIR